MKELIPQTRTYGVLRDIRYAVRGGRIPAWVRTVADFLGVTPFIRATGEGRITPSGFAFGKNAIIRKFAKSVVRQSRHLGPLTIAVGHANCPDDAAELEKLLRRDLPQIERLTMAQLGSALGVHAGPGSLVVAVQPFTTPPR